MNRLINRKKNNNDDNIKQEALKASSTELQSTAARRDERVATRRRDERVPRLKLIRSSSLDFGEDTSTRSGGSESSTKWNQPYEAPPLVEASSVIWMGVILFALAYIWPPLILILSVFVAKFSAYCFRINDDASKRRQLFTEFSRSRHGVPDKAFRNIPSFVKLEESFWPNARGMLLCTSIMTPRHMPIEAVVCFCHGYTDNASFEKRMDLQRLVQKGLAVITIEYEGHGRSDGPNGLIGNWDFLIDDVSSFFTQTIQQRFANKPVFLMGESMGGAVAFDTYQRYPDVFRRGVVFVCPMCKISEEMLPPPYVVNMLRWLIGPKSELSSSSDMFSSRSVSFLGYLPISPTKKLGSVSHRDPEKYELAVRCPTTFGRSVRLATARELIDASSRISNSLETFDAPFLVLHGAEDKITDPALSQALYDEAKSVDKSIRLYDGMWHALISGEPDDAAEVVMQDIQQWILARSSS